MGNCALSLSPPHVWALLEALWIDAISLWVDVLAQSAPGLTSRLSGSSVQLHIGIDGLSFSWSGLSPWDLRPPWDGSPVFCINKA